MGTASRTWGVVLVSLLSAMPAAGCREGDSRAGGLAFEDATHWFGNVNGAPNGVERPFCSCSVLLEDYDGDGRTDIFAGNHLIEDVLYRNRPDGFVNLAPEVGLADPLGERAAEGAVFGDADNDGDLDLYVLSGNREEEHEGEDENAEGPGVRERGGMPEPATDGFFLNLASQGGQVVFVPASEKAGITADTTPCGIAWLDIDGDGWLDSYRQGHHGQTVYRNLGAAVFEDATEAMGVGQKFDSDAMGIATADFDSDGDLDILVGAGPEEAGESGENVLLRNDGDALVDVAGAVDLNDPDSTFSAAWGDFDNDGDLDLYAAKNGLYGTPARNTLYRNEGGRFVDATEVAGVGDERISSGAVFADFDNDGFLDLYVLNGGAAAEGRDTLYRNRGDGTFADETAAAGLAGEDRRGYALTVGDFDRDGFLDVYTGNSGGDLNQLRANLGNGNHWIALDLEGAGAPEGSNRSAIGARVTLSTGGRSQIREVVATSPGNHTSLAVHFGLGRAVRADRVEIRWPSGISQVIEGLPADRYHRIHEEAGP